ncbi:MAG: alginate lyase family protein [Planctomycetota bacterium]
MAKRAMVGAAMAMVLAQGTALSCATAEAPPAVWTADGVDQLPSFERGHLFAPADIALARELVEAGDPEVTAARDAIIAEADRLVTAPIVKVTDGKANGERTAPLGDPRDYVSLSPYWWPDPDKEDGLPFIRRDGEINPDRSNYDADKLKSFGDTTRALAMGYLVTGDERYAERAAEHLRAWFVTPETRMVPRMQFGQFVPGLSEGRKSGIIETLRIRFVADAIEMLQDSKHWSASDDAAARQWYGEYLEWLMTSELGLAEAATLNNHGTWYATQCAQYALISGRDDIARQMVDHGFERVANQIKPDGSQPEEIARTLGLDYTCFNLRALMDMARYGQTLGIDLLNHETGDGRSIRAGIEFSVPFATDAEPWPYQQIRTTRYNMYNQLFRMALRRYGDPAFGAAIGALPALEQDDMWMAYVWPRRPEERAGE